MFQKRSSLVAVVLFVWLANVSIESAVASPAWASVLAKGVDICKIRQPVSDGAPEFIRVIALPGNTRAVAFGNSTSVETTVQCKDDNRNDPTVVLPAGCTAWPTDQEAVGSVDLCPVCPCEQTTSGSLSSSSNELLFTSGVGPACEHAAAGQPVDILLFGLGGGALHAYAEKHCPAPTRIESVEADPRMAAIATKFFGVPVIAGISEVDVDDALAAASSFAGRLNDDAQANTGSQSVSFTGLTAHGGSAVLRGSRQGNSKASQFAGQEHQVPPMGSKRWDVVATDCFIDHGVTPENCRSREFLTYIQLLARPGGTVLHHMWHTSPYDDTVASSFDDTLQMYKSMFGADNVQVQQVSRPAGAQWDSLIVVKA